MSWSRLRIMRTNASPCVRLVRLLRSEGTSHIRAACQPDEIFKMGFGLEQGPYRLSIAREPKELAPCRARYSARLHPSRK